MAQASTKINATAASLLGFLHERPMAGWDLVETAQQRIGDYWSLTRSQVYRELASMERSGLIQAEERGPRDRQPYRITDAGREAFRDWVMHGPGRETIRFPLLLTMLFGEHLPPERLAQILAEHRALHAARLEHHERTHASLPPEAFETHRFMIATLEFGIVYERAVLAWFDALPASIREPSDPRRNGPDSHHHEAD